jgi:dihydrofolate synthase/folylpolyglutamate synthase
VDLAAGLAYLDSHTNLEATAGVVHGLSLERMRMLASVLDDPQRAYPVIHVTGTNGKGSTVRMISSLVAATGLSVGTYTSPHLQRINERITRNGEPVSDDDLAALLSDVAAIEPVAGVTPSYFEILTAAAYRWFADIAVDVAVVEVGLLGRYDATNVADGAIAVVTNVGADHTDFVGDWRRQVAWEKAGIVKPGAILVLGETDPELEPVFGAEQAAQIWRRDDDFGCETNELAVGGRLLDLRTPAGLATEVFLPLHGAHQGDNAACALAAVEAFLGGVLADDVVAEGFASVTAPGRFEVVGRSPLLVLDGAHNAEGAAAVAATLAEDFGVDGRRIIVVGVLEPRDPEPLLDALDAASADLVVACTPPSPRAVPAEAVAEAARRLGAAEVDAVPDVGRAVDRALAESSPDDAVLVTGSLYVVGAARTHLNVRG